MDALIGLGLTALLLVVTFFIGQKGERDHFEDLRRREARLRSMPVTTFETLPPDWTPITSGIVTGSVVMSADYFKQFVAGFKKFFGGRLTVFEPLLDRARREAIARMLESARAKGFDAVINVRIEGSRINRSGTQKEGVVAVEMLAYGTGIKRGRKPVSKAPLPAV
jgi:uncharacterized protein YbjQ (UPF0145 family)